MARVSWRDRDYRKAYPKRVEVGNAFYGSDLVRFDRSGAEEVEDKFRGGMRRFGLWNKWFAVIEDLEGALGACSRMGDAEFGRRCGPQDLRRAGRSQSQAAIDNAYVHARLVVYCW
jgi:hypothetical protein